ncbi:MAG TPA: hypothetical protein VLS93_01240 [Anaeromyxobacteraceae bacterium]|nr:hypothetical protein [Anaeromyxobacteraceae bacterium]
MKTHLVLLGTLAIACGGPARIEMEPGSLRFFGRGQTLTVHATPVAKNGRPVPGKVCRWSSTDEKVAAVTGPHNEGAVVSAGPGSAAIRCTIGGVSAEVPVTVRVVARVAVQPARIEVKILDEATPAPLRVEAFDDTGALVLGRAALVRCLSEEVCRGDQRGQVWGVAPGETTATVEVEGATSAPVSVKVIDARTAEGKPQRVTGDPMAEIERAVRAREAEEAKARAGAAKR